MNSFINWQKFGACEHFINAFSNPYLGENPAQPSPLALSPKFSLSPSLSLSAPTPFVVNLFHDPVVVVVVTFNFQLSFVSTFALILQR